MAEQHFIFSIGYGNRSTNDFLSLLRRNDIQVVCDVRSTPYSGRFPDFSREALHSLLKQHGIKYLFMGDVLGARPSDPDCYVAGRASYKAMACSSAFQQGIERVQVGATKCNLALMCAEKEPMDCHRAILICRQLASEGFDVLHIDAKGKIEAHSDFEARLLKHYKLDQTSLFDERPSTTALSEAYDRREQEIAYVVAAYSAGR